VNQLQSDPTDSRAGFVAFLAPCAPTLCFKIGEASIPALAAWLVRFVHAMGERGPVMVAGHDIGGGMAQHLLTSGVVQVSRLALVNAVMYDSWPVPGVARFRDPAVAAATMLARAFQRARGTPPAMTAASIAAQRQP
jgi:pimeloyl-ACP methyl ester carboxylesterase